MEGENFTSFLIKNKNKTSLYKLWFAAYMSKKLTKSTIIDVNIENSVQDILQSKPGKMPLHTTGHLLLGVVQILSKKTKYLLDDCNEAFVKIKLAFWTGNDIPENIQNAFTIPDVFHDIENTIEDMVMEVDVTTNNLHQCRVEEITLKEDYGGPLSNMLEDEFANMKLNKLDMIENAVDIDEGFDDTGFSSKNVECYKAKSPITINNNFDEDCNELSNFESFANNISSNIPNANSVIPPIQAMTNSPEISSDQSMTTYPDEIIVKSEFIYEPRITQHKGKKKSCKRKRKMIDEIKIISKEEMRDQLSDCSDIMAILDLAPPTKTVMRQKETGTAEKLFILPGHVIHSNILSKLYTRHLVTHPVIKKEPQDSSSFFDNNANGVIFECAAKSRRLEEAVSAQMDYEYSQISRNIPDSSFIKPIEENQITEFGLHPNGKSLLNVMASMKVRDSGVGTSMEVTNLDAALENEMYDNLNENERDLTVLKAKENNQNQFLPLSTFDMPEEEKSENSTVMLNALRPNFEAGYAVPFSAIAHKNKRRQVAQKFYNCLVLKKQQAIEMVQSKAYEEIYIKKGPKYDNINNI